MLSRVAESVYWMSRYVERAENVARFVDVNYNLTLGETSTFREQWLPLIHTTGDESDFQARYGEPTRDNALRFLLFDAENPNSILSCISNARECARTVREVLPSAIWEQLNRFRLLVLKSSETGKAYEQPYDFCESVRTASQLLAGISISSMLRDESWSFEQMGRYIERADKTSRIVDVQYYILLPKVEDVGTSIDIVRWSSLLKSADALDMYRRTHGRIVPAKVAQFLILDPIFPRSIRFCANQFQSCLNRMRQNESEREDLPSERLASQLTNRLNSVSIDEIIDQGLHLFIDQLQGAINSLGNIVYADFFNTTNQTERRFIQQATASGPNASQSQTQQTTT
ncbi:MAG: alpha-E domain-containing protein [Planctomycetota bacterium]